MSIETQVKSLRNEAKALIAFFRVDEPELRARFAAFDALWNDSLSTTEQLEEAANYIEARMEDVCIAHRIGQEQLEMHMQLDPSYEEIPY